MASSDIVYPMTHPVVYGKGPQYRIYFSTLDKDAMISAAHEKDGIPMDEHAAWDLMANNHPLANEYGVIGVITPCVLDETRRLVALERQIHSVTDGSVMHHAMCQEIARIRQKIGLKPGKYSQGIDLDTVNLNNPLIPLCKNFEDDEVRRTDSCARASYRKVQIPEVKCPGCRDLNADEGGENQMAHMGPGGCLEPDDDDYLYEDTPVSHTTTQSRPLDTPKEDGDPPQGYYMNKFGPNAH